MLDAVVPVYNEETILPELNRRLRESLDTLDCPWRIIYVDDGSRDGSADLLADFAAEDSPSSTCRATSASSWRCRRGWQRPRPMPW